MHLSGLQIVEMLRASVVKKYALRNNQHIQNVSFLQLFVTFIIL